MITENPWPGRLLAALIAVAVAWLFIRFVEWRSLFFPRRHLDSTPAEVGLDYEDITFVTEDGVNLHGWWIPVPGAKGTLILCHGNAGNIGDRVRLAADLVDLGLNLFLFDYRGYGRSRGLPSEKGTYRDARAAYEYVRARYADVDVPPVVVLGRSLGGAVGAQLALDKPVRGLVLESTFTSVPEMAQSIYPVLPVRLICRYRYDTLSKVGLVKIPKLIVHGPNDEVVPFAQGRRLYEAAAEPKQFMELRGTHNDAGWDAAPGYLEALQSFVTGLRLGDEYDGTQ